MRVISKEIKDEANDITWAKKPSTKFWECSHVSGVGRGNYGSYKNRRIVRVVGKKCIKELENQETYTSLSVRKTSPERRALR